MTKTASSVQPAAATAHNAATAASRRDGAHVELDLRVAWSGTGLTTHEVEAALGDVWNRTTNEGVAPQRDFAHTGPGTLAGRLLRAVWQPAYIAGDLRPGWAATVKVLGTEITLCRSQAGRAFALGGRCAHRGLLLSTGTVEGEGIRCAYHGWKYNAEGKCVAQPAEPHLDEVRIPGYPVHEYLGLLFVYLGGDAPPEPPRYPEF